jgi:rSAM/selenodomain-associated transferase 1
MTSNTPRPDAVRIAVFAKAPVAGEVKTRLAALLGAAGAASLHAGLARRALATAVRSGLGPVELWCAPDAADPFFAQCAREFGVTLRRQEGADLGERMANAFADSTPLLVIGSDCPALDAAHLLAAAQALSSHDVVIQPAEDGGYVLIGLSKPAPALFRGIEWSAPTVMARTRERIAASGLRCRELAALWDVDRPEDYARLQQAGWLAEVLS